jgi:3-oxoacyl-[acyl-carrier protein] reductase
MPHLDFSNQVVLVTGASSGVGAAAAVGFAEAGATVAVHYNSNKSGGQETLDSAGGNGSLHQADLTDRDAAGALVDAVLAEHGRIDVLVNNAGDLISPVPLADISAEDFDRAMSLNLNSVFTMSQRVVPVFRRQGSGSIVNVTSAAGRTGQGLSGAYATGKGAANTLTRALALELAAEGIRVNAISPGALRTSFLDRHLPAESLAAFQDAVSGMIPMGRMGRPEDCVGTILYLASDALSGYVTGQVIEVGGGVVMA